MYFGNAYVRGQESMLNPGLYGALYTLHNGDVLVVNKGEPVVYRKPYKMGDRLITDQVHSYGETYRTPCPFCGTTHHKLYVSHAFGSRGPSGNTVLLNRCYKCGEPKTQYLLEALALATLSAKGEMIGKVAESDVTIAPFINPGLCVSLATRSAENCRAWDYLTARGIDPTLAAAVYGWSYCIVGNPDIYYGAMTSRIIAPMTSGNSVVGYQGRLTYDPPKGAEGLDSVRWLGMPGSGWKQSSIMGLDQVNSTLNHLIVVEGPGDMVRHGPPFVATLGIGLTNKQADLIARRLNRFQSSFVVILSDSGENEKAASVKMANKLVMTGYSGTIFIPSLPYGDPGSWDTKELRQFILDTRKESIFDGKSTTTGSIDSELFSGG